MLGYVYTGCVGVWVVLVMCVHRYMGAGILGVVWVVWVV